MRLPKYLAACLIALSFDSALAAVQMLDRIVATIDDDVITQSELDERVAEVVQRSQAAGMRLPATSVLQEQILEQLISESLQLSAAKRYGVTVSDQELIDATENILAARGWTQEEFLRQLKAQGTDYDGFRETMRKQLTLQNVSQGLIRSRVKISEQDVDNFLKSADARFWISPDYNLSHILIALPSSADVKQAKAAEDKANDLYRRLTAGANFEETALAESAGPLALEGGNMGWRKSSELPTLFAEIAPTLAPGEIAKPARSGAGFHILKLNEVRGETKQIVNQTKARHILLKNSAILNDEQAQQKLKELRQQVLDGADFAELAKQHSEDIGSKLAGGDLGWASPGQFVPAFEAAMASTDIGEITQPFKSPFGWHILQVQERREEDMTEQALRVKARNVLLSRRFEDEVQLWIQEMRDNAFIEIKI